jgi:hypothetical protein
VSEGYSFFQFSLPHTRLLLTRQFRAL